MKKPHKPYTAAKMRRITKGECMSTQPKTCLSCTHCRITWGDGGYSEDTPGDDGAWECRKGHFKDEQPDKEAMERDLLKATDCADYASDAEARAAERARVQCYDVVVHQSSQRGAPVLGKSPVRGIAEATDLSQMFRDWLHTHGPNLDRLADDVYAFGSYMRCNPAPIWFDYFKALPMKSLTASFVVRDA